MRCEASEAEAEQKTWAAVAREVGFGNTPLASEHVLQQKFGAVVARAAGFGDAPLASDRVLQHELRAVVVRVVGNAPLASDRVLQHELRAVVVRVVGFGIVAQVFSRVLQRFALNLTLLAGKWKVHDIPHMHCHDRDRSGSSYEYGPWLRAVRCSI